MRRSMMGLAALGVLVALAPPAPAAWNNVFQPTLFHRNRQPTAVSQYYVPPTVVQASPIVAAASPCSTCEQPQTACTTKYTQRCFYQPVTTYQTQTYYEPVTTYKTSYYYEAVTSYRYTSNYDPCSCSYQQVATPCTSYQLKAKSCPVQSWVERCCQVPVTSYQKSCYWQPQTTCCTTTPGAPIPMTSQPPVYTQPQLPQQPPVYTQPPAAVPSITPPTGSAYPPGVYEQRNYGTGTGASMYDKMYPPQPTAPTMPPASFKTPRPLPQGPAPAVRLEGVVMGPDTVQGQVVRNDRSPKANAKVMFVSAQGGQRFFAAANSAGRFNVSLPTGNWNVYLYGADDLPIYNTQLAVGGPRLPGVTLVSR